MIFKSHAGFFSFPNVLHPLSKKSCPFPRFFLFYKRFTKITDVQRAYTSSFFSLCGTLFISRVPVKFRNHSDVEKQKTKETREYSQVWVIHRCMSTAANAQDPQLFERKGLRAGAFGVNELPTHNQSTR